MFGTDGIGCWLPNLPSLKEIQLELPCAAMERLQRFGKSSFRVEFRMRRCRRLLVAVSYDSAFRAQKI